MPLLLLSYAWLLECAQLLRFVGVLQSIARRGGNGAIVIALPFGLAAILFAPAGMLFAFALHQAHALSLLQSWSDLSLLTTLLLCGPLAVLLVIGALGTLAAGYIIESLALCFLEILFAATTLLLRLGSTQRWLAAASASQIERPPLTYFLEAIVVAFVLAFAVPELIRRYARRGRRR